MLEEKEYLKISELSKISGFSVSRIRYYVSKGILSQPIKVNKTHGYYTREHLARLELLKMISSKKRITSIFKEIMNVADDKGIVSNSATPDESQIVRRRIVHSSIAIFRKKGYEGTTITDIVAAAHISRNTIYKYFKNKKDLFLECLNITFSEYREKLPKELQSVHDLKDTEMILRNFINIAEAFSRIYPTWSDMMNLLRAAAVKDPRSFAKKLEDAYDLRIRPLHDDFQYLVKQKVFRNINPKIASIITAGAAEYMLYFSLNGKLDKDDRNITEEFYDILFYGLFKK
ncbi:MAG: TetR family transcriptional regulator [Dehalococcoidia bacterium]|jgi:AcrR family transcriptional regulator